MSRYSKMFKQCEEQNAIAFIPFVMMGDPGIEESLTIIKTLVDSGANALELGIPFSDPVADGPVIQAAAIRALDKGVTPDQCFELLRNVRELFPDIPIGLLLYSNLVYRRGINKFFNDCATAGVDSVLIADVPVREAAVFDHAATEQGVAPVHILPPNPSEQTVQQVAELSKGYTYVLGRAGVTGADVEAQMPDKRIMQQLELQQAAPPVMGFGISKPAQVTAAKRHGFKGAISGSAVVNIVQQNLENKNLMLNQLGNFVSAMKKATLD
jgi:tryptophan synthase alpha chain